MSGAAELADRAWRAGLAPEPRLTVSEWADRHRVLPPTSAEPGRWRTDRVPYLRGIMDCLSTGSGVERVVFMKGAQIGGTEAGLNWLGYIAHHAPGLVLLVMPSLDMVRRNTRTRIDPMIEATPALSERIAPPRAKDSNNSAYSKSFPGGVLVMAGANSAAGLRSTPARYVFLDEVDGFPADADGEGDPVDLAMARTITFRAMRRILMVSTPTIAGESRIEAAFAESDQRRYHIPCPHCGAMHALAWANVRWPEGRPDRAEFVCPGCGATYSDGQKVAALGAGEWRATAAGDGRTAGFHLSALYSPFQPLGDIASAFVRVRKDPARLQVWVNTALGETWEDRGTATATPDGLAARREVLGDTLPAGIAVLTMGVDVQGDRLEAQLVGWGRDEEAWILEHRVLWGDPSGPAVWADLDTLLLGTRAHPNLGPLTIRAACVDSGGINTSASYEFARARLARRVWAVKGRGGPGVKPWPARPSRGKGGAPVFLVGVDSHKDTIAARLAIAEPGPGCLHFAADLPPDFFEQLTAERIRTKYVSGRPVRSWVLHRDGARNEALDCLVYASAALHGLYSMGLRLNEEAAAAAGARQPAARPVVQRSRWLTRPGGGRA